MILITKLVLGFVLANINPITSTNYHAINAPLSIHMESINDVSTKTKALKILQNKCNVCHKKRNPFMIFKQKNINFTP